MRTRPTGCIHLAEAWIRPVPAGRIHGPPEIGSVGSYQSRRLVLAARGHEAAVVF